MEYDAAYVCKNTDKHFGGLPVRQPIDADDDLVMDILSFRIPDCLCHECHQPMSFQCHSIYEEVK